MPFQSDKRPVLKNLKDVIKQLDENTRDYNAAIEKAKACLASPQFKEYAKHFEETAQDIIDLMLEIPIIDPVEFAFQMNELRSRLKSLRSLGFAVNAKALLEPRKIQKQKDPTAAGSAT